ncbi:MAG TPA: galactokinase [Streptosporangiaceae bacterium]|nr:galactokinase [Streptosporangiaceae bacterium]
MTGPAGSAVPTGDRGVWFAPGRANLMGEHTDYNDGFVLPFALAQGTTASAVRRSDGVLSLTSRQEPGPAVEIALDDLDPGLVTDWTAYPAGVAWALREAGHDIPGATITIDSDVPAGAGLSSSAALECAVALALTALAGLDLPRGELAAIARRAENEFAGVPSGIMDQSASLLCQEGHALLLDCQSLETTQVPCDARLLVINTNARHELTAGDYGARRAECEEAARLLSVPTLRLITDCGVTSEIPDRTLRKRARHVCTDNERVLRSVELLRASSYEAVGALLTQAHASLRDDFEISWPEADVAVDAALSAGALGARMIGGGFGGSVLAMLPAEDVPVREAVTKAFAARSWAAAEFYAAVPSAGARRLS